MRKLFLLLGCLFIFTGCVKSNSVPPKLNGVELAKMITDDTVALVWTNPAAPEKTRVFCSGVWISDSLILTADHCMIGVSKAMSGNDDDDDTDFKLPEHLHIDYVVRSEITNVAQNPTTTHGSQVVYANQEQDLAILKIDADKTLPRHGVATLAMKTPEVGEKIEVVGHPSGITFSYREGQVAAYREDMSGIGLTTIKGPFLQISAPIYHGDSGGACFNDMGDVVGIASFMSGSSPNTGFYIHIDTIKKALVALVKTNK